MGKFVSLVLAAGLLISTHTGNVHAAVAVPSPALTTKHAIVAQADVEYCYWKLKKNGKWKWKCDD
jgi:hypothetical protein